VVIYYLGCRCIEDIDSHLGAMPPMFQCIPNLQILSSILVFKMNVFQATVNIKRKVIVEAEERKAVDAISTS
jgi:hypothetical protein